MNIIVLVTQLTEYTPGCVEFTVRLDLQYIALMIEAFSTLNMLSRKNVSPGPTTIITYLIVVKKDGIKVGQGRSDLGGMFSHQCL